MHIHFLHLFLILPCIGAFCVRIECMVVQKPYHFSTDCNSCMYIFYPQYDWYFESRNVQLFFAWVQRNHMH